jgi:Ser/Thr protein kinase RdoA (MazF antagonist)
MLQLAQWLELHAPERDAMLGKGSIVHGDYRLDNLIYSSGSTVAKVLAVLDWELSTLGDPLSDLAYNCLVRSGCSCMHNALIAPLIDAWLVCLVTLICDRGVRLWPKPIRDVCNKARSSVALSA